MADAKPAKWALETAVLETGIPPHAKLLMLTLLAKAEPRSLDLGKYSPGTRKLHDQTGMKRDTVIKFLGLLEKYGWLTIRKRPGKTDEYVLSKGNPFRVATTRKPPQRGPVKGTTPPVSGPTDGTTTGPTDGTEPDQIHRGTNRYDPRVRASQTVPGPGDIKKPEDISQEELERIFDDGDGKPGEEKAGEPPVGCSCFDCMFGLDTGEHSGEAGIK